ncbi:MAG: aminoglycoside phosphotransferase family protein [Pseudomonadota bacterium]
MEDEHSLIGGNVTRDVVRVVQTVRKPRTPFDIAATALLNQLEAAGVSGVPRARGYDTKGRRILSWLPGATAFPKEMWTKTVTLTSAAERLRQIHDASRPLLTDSHTWAITTPGPEEEMVIGHSDFAPYNMVFADDGAVIGVFDFDLAGPAPRVKDLAYLAWWLVPFGEQVADMRAATGRDVKHGSIRLHMLCAAYGVNPDMALLDAIAQVLRHMGDPTEAGKMIGGAAARRLADSGHFDHWQRAAHDFALLRPRIAANLSRSL